MRPEDRGAGRLSWWHEIGGGERSLDSTGARATVASPALELDDDEDYYPRFDDEDERAHLGKGY